MLLKIAEIIEFETWEKQKKQARNWDSAAVAETVAVCCWGMMVEVMGSSESGGEEAGNVGNSIAGCGGKWGTGTIHLKTWVTGARSSHVATFVLAHPNLAAK
nr:hypothetical protein [Tanacetum cinerariifolium]